MLNVFTVIFAILIVLGTVLLLRRRAALNDRSKASLGLALGIAAGGTLGLILSQIAGTFVYILPVSLGVGMALGWSLGWMTDSLIQKD